MAVMARREPTSPIHCDYWPPHTVARRPVVGPGALHLIILTGLLLVGLAVYVSLLSFVMRLYSRTRLAERLSDRLPEQKQADWVEWLERHETELQVLLSFL